MRRVGPVGRRAVLAGIGGAAMAPAMAMRPPATTTAIVVSTDAGVTTAMVDRHGDWRVAPRAMAGGLVWAVPHRNGVVACTDTDPNRVLLLARDGSATSIGHAAGKDACHLAVDTDEQLAAVADYGLGAVSLHRIDRPGVVQIVQHEGRGADPIRQAGPHAHWVGFSRDARWLFAVDLGADAVFAHRINRDRIIDTQVAWQAPPGTGPRHMVRHPIRAIVYVVGELTNTLDTLHDAGNGRFVTLDRQSTLERGFAVPSYAGHIAVDPKGCTLYVSNRGADMIAVFSLVDPARPVLIQHAAVAGHWPRFFLLQAAARRILVANERGSGMTLLPVAADGTLGPASPGPPIAKAKFAIGDWSR